MPSSASPPEAIRATDPIFRKLREGLLWHFTQVASFRKIVVSGCIEPRLPDQKNRWESRPYACQSLSAVCLFDFHTAPEANVLQAASIWKNFLVRDNPLTVLIGLDERRLKGRLVRYPENRDITPKEHPGPIPDVEVCHVGSIPVSAFANHILVCAVDVNTFRCVEALTENVLEETTREFEAIVAAAMEKKTAELTAFRSSPRYGELVRVTQQVRRQRAEKHESGG